MFLILLVNLLTRTIIFTAIFWVAALFIGIKSHINTNSEILSSKLFIAAVMTLLEWKVIMAKK